MSATMYPDDTKSDIRRGHQLVHTRVVSSCDKAGLGRVMVQIPWIDAPVSAEVAVPTAGNGSGTFFIPRVDDEVLVLVGEPPDESTYVIGSLWTSRDVPPRRDSDAASRVQVIRTPAGHEIELDDHGKSITVTTMNKQRVYLSESGVEIRSTDKKDGAVITLETNGNIKVSGATVKITATGTLKLEAKEIKIKASGRCAINGSTVAINDPS